MDTLPCGCTGSRSVLHLTLHHPLAYAVGGAVVGVAFLFTGKGSGGVLDALLMGLLGALIVWMLARVVK